MERIDISPVVMKRTEQGKKLRKAYESGQIHHGFNEHRIMDVHWGGACNTISTVTKDFLICEVWRSETMNYVKVKQNTSDGFIKCEVGGVADLAFPSSKTRRGRVQGDGQISPTITTIPSLFRIEGDGENEYRIRRLTSLETWLMMGFSEEDYLSAKTGSRDNARKYMQQFEPDNHFELMRFVDQKGVQEISSSQLYKQAGNSITTCTLYYIYKNLYKAMPYLFDNLKVGSFFSGIGAFEKALDMLQEDLRDNKKPFFAMK